MTADYTLAILGAGPVGQALALLLARATRDPARIALITEQADPVAPLGPTGVQPAPRVDPRALALNYGSRVMLESVGAWPVHAAGIETIHVSQRGRLGRVLIDRRDFDVPELGYVVAYPALTQGLSEAVAASGVTVLHGARARIERQDANQVIVARASEALRVGLAVACDGAAVDGVTRQYEQHAVLATVRASQPKTRWAFERFTREGPMALLPHPQGNGMYSLVWCVAPERASALVSLDDDGFSQALTLAFGDRLGRLSAHTPRQVFPLGLVARREIVAGRTAAIGNAAQTLHPVAGQGLNLGLRDAFQLAHALQPWLLEPQRSPEPVLAAFARARQGDRWITAGLTDLMPRAFATGVPWIEHACGLGLLALDTIEPLRRPLARQLLYGRRS